jgi:hypothetical protein
VNINCQRQSSSQDDALESSKRADGEAADRPICVLYHVKHPISGRQAYVVGPSVDSAIRACALIFRALQGDALQIAELAGGPGRPQLLVHESAVAGDQQESGTNTANGQEAADAHQ